MPSAVLPLVQQWQFHHNIPEFMEGIITDECVEIRGQSQVLFVKAVDYKGDKNHFASEHVVHGRKNDDVLWHVDWFTGDAAPFEDVGDNKPSSAITNQEGVGVW